MRTHFDDALVAGCHRLLPVGLDDKDDEHVVAAAVLGGAGAIVTHNVKDFPRDRLPSALLVRQPHAFAEDMVAADLRGAARAVTEMAHRMKNPPLGATDILDLLATRYGMGAAVQPVRNFFR